MAQGPTGEALAITAADLREWFVSALADMLELAKDEIDADATFDRYGLDSSAAVGLIDNLGTWLGCDLDATLLYDYPTINALARHLVEQRIIQA